jgi:glutathione S-transferase
MTLELYHNDRSTCSQKVRICLAEKSLDWVNRHINIGAEENLSPDYLKLNPNGVVPTLVHDGAPIIESTVICEYLDEIYPEEPHLSPRDPVDRAHMRVWLRYNDEVPSMAIRVPTFQNVILPRFQKMSQAEFEAFVERNPLRKPFLKRLGRSGFSTQDYDIAIEQLEQSLTRMEMSLNTGDWLVGDEYSIADICIVPILQRLEDLGMKDMWEKRPAVSDWYERMRARPAYRKAFYKGSLLTD